MCSSREEQAAAPYMARFAEQVPWEGLLRAPRREERHRHGACGRHLRLLRGLDLPQPQVPPDVSLNDLSLS